MIFTFNLLNTKCGYHCDEVVAIYTDQAISYFIIQQIVTMPIYGQEALNICHPYVTDILRYT